MKNFVIGLASLAVFSASQSLFADITLSPRGEIRTPAAALERVRALRAAGKIDKSRLAVIACEGGTYELGTTLTLGADDSLVRFVGAKDGSTVFSGGVELPPFTAGADGVWRTAVPKGFVFEQLWVNGRRAQVAKSPNAFYHYIREAGKGAEKKRRFKTDAAALACLKDLTREELAQVAVRVWWSWNDELCCVKSVDAAAGDVELTADVRYDFFYWPKYCTRFTIENCRAALDAPGEWFLNRRTGVISYIPREGEDAATARAVAPRLGRLATVDGATDVTFENIAFEHQGWVQDGAFFAYQSANRTGAAVEVRNAARIAFRNCRVRHTAEYALWLDAGTRDSTVAHSLFSDLGAGGVRIGSRNRWSEKKPDENMTSGLVVEDNIIADGGHVFPAGTGILATYTRDTKITHNEICDLYYSGICCGWCWGYGPHPNRNVEITWNHIHHLGKGVLSDMGFVYLLGDHRGSVVAGNRGHDIFSYGYTGSGGTGLYPDEGTRGVLWTSNLVYRTKTSCLSQHYGRENRFVNNIFAFPLKEGASAAGRWRAEPHLSLAVSNNVFVWKAGRMAFDGPLTVKDLSFDRNVWWSPDGATKSAFSNGDFASWQKAGLDVHSVCADPQFVDLAHDDFRLKPSSPAIALGFKPWDYDEAGVRRSDAKWRAFAESLTPAGYAVPPVPPKNPGTARYLNDFENVPDGKVPEGFRASGNDSAHGFVRATSSVARNGKKALEYRDFKGLKTAYWPHFNQPVMLTTDIFVYRIAFKADKAANWQCEWRENTDGTYKVGPRFGVQDGKVFPSVGGHVPGEWETVEVTFHSSANAASSWDFALIDAKGVRHEKKGLPCVHAACRTPDWIGYLSWGDADSVTYFDDWFYENR